MSSAAVQLAVFVGLNVLVGLATWWHCRRVTPGGATAREYFLAGGGLNWVFIAGSITLTNINTDTLVGLNGGQRFLLVWWELAAVAGLALLAWVFLPIYYRQGCVTVTELLERRYGSAGLRVAVAGIFLLGNALIFLPVMLYTSALLLRGLFGLTLPLPVLAAAIAVVGAAYAVGGGLRAVAVSDTYNGIIVLGMALLVAVLALRAVGWDLSGVPAERLTLLGGPDSPLPWPTLLTGMGFTQLFYWSTNQTITQRALAAPSLGEAQRGVLAAAVIRLVLIPPIVVLPGVCAFKLHGALGDATYGRIAAEVLPPWLEGAFGAAMFAAVLTSYNSTLNASAALYVCDFHQRLLNAAVDVRRLGVRFQVGLALGSIALVPAYAGAASIIQLIQQLIGLFSMPILAAFIVGLVFRGVAERAVLASLGAGSGAYALFAFGWPAWHARHPTGPAPWHFLHGMALTVVFCVGFALLFNRFVCGGRARWAGAAGAR